ncbi:zinc ABC transporter permease AztB [Paramicrobacterium chengjingii]|uniref:Metal ABC transporter permease n=1 Tax=Paramicrobacterium chengjingii TaxID=2769067 RepID=A0ABX6YIH0_9MICO|nr:zinc ABC transporter permease AztB [Microbacterium chengjingii]QPZ38602.1 metal ABC transporter permease [Microbacterium chengjingii]
MSWLIDPLTADFVVRAAVGGLLVAAICGVVGTWVVIRGMAFLGEAIGHGMLPGVALASLLGFPLVAGAAVSAIAMSTAIGLLQRRGRLSYDTSIGLLFVGMLSLGVIIVSHSRTFATDATAMLFGDILAIGAGDIAILAVALAATLVVAGVLHRAFVVAAFDGRIATTLGLAPQVAHGALVGLVTLAVVASYQAVGSLLVVGLLIAPAVAARVWADRIPAIMALAAAVGAVAVLTGLLLSWHFGTAAGASIALSAIVLAAASSLARTAAERLRREATPHDSIRPQTPPESTSPAAPFAQTTSRAPASPVSSILERS